MIPVSSCRKRLAMQTEIGFDREELEMLLKSIDVLDEQELLEIEKMLEELDRRAALQAARDDLIAFCKRMDPNYKVGRHHRMLADQLMAIERGEKDRICVNIPPRHGKSQLVSTYYPAWFIGRNPGKKVMLVSHTSDLAVDFGRKVRNLIDSDAYQEIFPGVALSVDSKSAGRWNTTTGCEFYATGVGSALAGRGADLLLVDDPHSEQDILNGNFSAFDKAYDWFAFGARTRLMPGGRVAIVHCMTGDTPVLRPDGSETPLRDLRPGDMVASYQDGELVSKRVLNWANMGEDAIFAVNLDNGKSVRANARHPFLVARNGVETWVKVRDLRVGDSVVSITADVLGKQRQSRAYVTAVLKKLLAFAAGQLLGKTTKTQESFAASKGAPTTRYARVNVESITTRNIGAHTKTQYAQKSYETITCSENTASAPPITSGCWNGKGTNVAYAKSMKTLSASQLGFVRERHLLSITATLLDRFVSYFATAATYLCSLGSLSKFYSTPFSTSKITSITPDGIEDVFDIEVEDTHNFIAGSSVVSNTRWHENDLTGRLVKEMTNTQEADQYEVVEFPAILEVEDKEAGRLVQKALWPEFFDLPALLRTKASMAAYQWNAQYQQNPTGEEAAIIKREWWRLWPNDDPPHVEYIIMSLDAAAETNSRADFTALTTWGVFFNEEEDNHQIVLLNSIKRRLEFPELKKLCLDEYAQWEPDSFIVEKKSAGTAIFQELRRMGLPVAEYTPHRGTGDKLARLNSVSDIVASGMVWVPPKRWAEELVEEVAGFPFAQHDDLVDSSVMALMRFRQGGFIRLPTDEKDEELPYRPRVEYY